MDYIRVRNWEKFQQYKDREPKWIKLYRSLLHNYEWHQLDDAAKGQLVSIWLLAAELDNKIPNDELWIRNRIGCSEVIRLEEMLSLSFLEMYNSVQKCTEVCTGPYNSVHREEKRRGEKSREDTVASEDAPKRFQKPTVEEVAEYIQEKGYHVNAEDFWHHYEANDWMRGKNRLKKWKSAVALWERKHKERMGIPDDPVAPPEELPLRERAERYIRDVAKISPDDPSYERCVERRMEEIKSYAP